MTISKKYSSLFDYYRKNFFNPVPISIEDENVWEDHVCKRRNLYDHHLGIPISMLKGRKVIEFGCNSGENSLVLAQAGADLTLVEPNEQVVKRLIDLFGKFGLSERISSLQSSNISDFKPSISYDLAIAEGFLFSLPNRDDMLLKMGQMLAPGGICIVSFNDRCGFLIEMIKRLYIWRACDISSEDVHGKESLNTAIILFGEDFEKLNKSRSLEAWWKDTLVQPYIIDKYLWSYQELIPLLERGEMELLSCSPRWISCDSFNWYKNTVDTKTRHTQILSNWSREFPFIVTGRKFDIPEPTVVSDEVVNAVLNLISKISSYASDEAKPGDLSKITYPEEFDKYMTGANVSELELLSNDLKKLIETVQTDDINELINTYQNAFSFRTYWGTPYHYISCSKSY